MQLTKTVKQYRISEIPSESWEALYRFFWGKSMAYVESLVYDGINADGIETTKYGIRISCTMWFLPSGKCQTDLLLARPRFSSILDFNPKKLDAAKILDCCLEKDGSLSIEVG